MSEKPENAPRVLIVSWSPIPTPKYQKIEGSGQRFFGLAKGLQFNGLKDITIAVGAIYPLDVSEVDGIKLFNYDFNNEFAERLREYDTVIFNYTIHGSSFVAQNVPISAQVVIDAYGPAYIENLARNPKDLVGHYTGNLAAVKEVFNKVMPRGDYFLYANDAQEKFYTGVLCSLGIINQFSFNTQRLLHVPFGIDKQNKNIKYSNPYWEYGVGKDDFVLLWFGGLYPWFDITKILDMLRHNKNKNIKFVIVGGNNPQNQHPDFIKHYYDTVEYIKKNKLENQTILIEWADFATRRKYYDHANVIISLNRESHENVYSWRTRVMDYVGSSTPLISNGGDPLSDELIASGAAFKVDENDEHSIATLINELIDEPTKLKNASKNLQEIRPKYYWHNVTKDLAKIILAQTRPYYDELIFRRRNNIVEGIVTQTENIARSRSIKSAGSLVVSKVQSDGVRVTYRIIKDKVHRRAAFEYQKRFQKTIISKPRIVVVSNQLNNTGAPFVLIDLIDHLINRNPDLIKKIRFITFTPIELSNIKKLEKNRIEVEVYTNRDLTIEFNQDDIVLFNTFAISHNTASSAIKAIKDGKVKKLYWYGHEHSPEGFIDHELRSELIALLKADKAKIYAVSEATLREYIKFFGMSQNIEKMPFPFLFPKDKFRSRNPEDFNKLTFVTTGSLMDMRKGQYPVLYAFLDFYHNHYKKSPQKYRDFFVEFIGAYEKSDLGPRAAYHVRNIKRQFDLSAAGLEAHFGITPSLPHYKAIEKIEQANITICYSLFEALGIFVYEGMATGHPIIRNESAGQEEQLVEGKNGFGVSSKDFPGLVEVIEKLLNKKKTTNAELSEMSSLSMEIAKKATDNDYTIIDDINVTFRTRQHPRNSSPH